MLKSQKNFLGLFKANFEEVYRNQEIGSSPSFGIGYRGKNSSYLKMDSSLFIHMGKLEPILYKINPQKKDQSDHEFLSILLGNLKKNLGYLNSPDYFVEGNIMTIPPEHPNPIEDSSKDLTNILCAFAGFTKDYYKDVLNKARERKNLDLVAGRIANWSIKNEKEPLWIVFNYYPNEAPDQLIRVLEGDDLDEFLKQNSEENL